ncbi:RNA polymerase III subunit Rpc25-domain-containing protein [Cladorrhinum sp. PSN259]|nr:RNA polymerase III subunit Rpc25-domain-containing protein [Cladorrhinum sp. PSN259]
MFILTKLADLVQIAPKDFGKVSIIALQDAINTKYSNKLIPGIGLCICLQEVLWHSEGLIGHGDGLVNVNVEFNMVVFRPFKGETIQARIASQTPEGMRLSTEFFDSIYVPHSHLPDGTEFNAAEGVWIWKTEDQELYFDLNEIVRLKVISEEWHDQTPTEPIELADDSEAAEKAISNRRPVYSIIGTMDGTGLGCCLWWDE